MHIPEVRPLEGPFVRNFPSDSARANNEGYVQSVKRTNKENRCPHERTNPPVDENANPYCELDNRQNDANQHCIVSNKMCHPIGSN
jgi:hypothetical protein